MAKRARRGGGRRRHRLLVGALPVLLLVVPTAVGNAQQAGDGQRSEPETGEIRNGTAKATALLSRIGPGVGNLELAMRGGIAVTQVTNSLAQATSQTLDLGLIGGSLTAEGCDGSRPIEPSDLPQPTSTDNRGGDTRRTESDAQTEGQPFGLGQKEVAAAVEPVTATAVTTSNGIDLAPALRLGNGRSRAETRVLPGEGREAAAFVESSIEIAGALDLRGLQWHAHHRTGVDPTAQASFEIGRASIGGVPFPTDDLRAVEAAANEALAPLGVTLELPRVERFVEPADLIRLTPLRIEVRDSPAGKTIFGPLLEGSREQRGDLFDAITAEICQTAGVLLVGDVVVSILSGTGFLTLEVGGAEAASSDLEVTDPFGPPVAPVGAGVAPPSGGEVPLPASAVDSTVAPAPPSSTSEQAVPATSRSGPLEELCESVHPNGDRCSEGAAVALGLLALAGTVGVAGADLFRHRRARSVDPAP